MAKRKIIKIDEEKCTGCGLCVPSCAEGAIQIIDGKAKLVADNLCDGLGACLGDCPEDAITIEERDADEFDEAAVGVHLKKDGPRGASAQHAMASPRPHSDHGAHGGGCPGSRMLTFDRTESTSSKAADAEGEVASELRQWPVQMHLVSPLAPYFQRADVLLAADCVAFSVGDFHRSYLRGKALAIACPKLDTGKESYAEKLVAMIDDAEINTFTVMVMEVPCCTGLVTLAQQAVANASRKIPIKKIVVSLKGEQLSEQWI
ncbi:MAG: 4Fe-4S binding protein [Deltaproteobacteria bacterium]|nr:4Fe-4S binding protein [Deltaproteobacteria bacterium]MBN2672434.1 4Fe-4S binding protein [Deltaproteobacteria bacterium]